ncbi:hypothetical protein [uncultured Cycloclasticus sp.]|jgi:transcription elongation factor Elf1|uniref:hypothetical protein n=1 Tax=uncultured Cycloclasticus sp. TaxID=172194 RepID=UPI00258B45CB|nr:hypothetical protein [uncultured Cycloclasticus sp.]
MILTTPASWDKDALLIKAQRYSEQMLQHDPTDWQFVLWSSFALEFLSRAALSNVSPVLLADQKNWHNIFHALGHEPNAKKFLPKSIIVADVLSRLSEIYPDFNSELELFCIGHTGMRNAELHSGDMPYDGLKQSAWLANYYRASAILLGTMGKELADLIGDDTAKLASQLINAAADDAAKAVMGKIKSHKTVWNEKESAEKETLLEQAKAWATKHLGHRVDCPACNSVAIVQGQPISAPTTTLNNDIIIEKQQYLPNKFECIACGMKISGLSSLGQAGLGDVFISTNEYDASEYYAPEEDWNPYEEDNNEPF